MRRMAKTVATLALCGMWFRAIVVGALGGEPEHEAIRLASVPRPFPDGKAFVFVWKGDIWQAPMDGGQARQLTRHPAPDHWPCISPDGRELAFASKRDDAWQVYIMSAAGGGAEQITWNTEGATPLAWFPDGKSLLVRGSRDQSGSNAMRLFRVSRMGDAADELLFDALAYEADISPDGRRVLFTAGGVDLYRKGYHGSRASRIWLYDLDAGTSRLVCDDPSGSRSPLWRPDGTGFYYLCQRDGCFNVWEHELTDGRERQLTHYTDASVIIPGLSRDGSRMIFRQLFDFCVLDPRQPAEPKRLDLWSLADGARETVRRRWYQNAWNCDTYGTVDFTEDGLQIAFTAGGDLWVMDTVLRDPHAVFSGTAVHETEAVFTRDAQALLCLRDFGDRVELWRAQRTEPDKFWWQNTAFESHPLLKDDTAKYNLSVSPDGKHIAYCAERGNVYVTDADGSNGVCVASSPFEAGYDWSPDGKWLTCSLADSYGNRDVWIVSTDGKREPFNLSRHPNADYDPKWSPDGRIIAFVGRRYDDKTALFYVYLAEEDDRVSERDRTLEKALEKMENGQKKAGENGKGKTAEPADARADVRIDFEGLADRIHRVDISGSPPADIFWSFDSKALAFKAAVGGKRGTYKIVFPDHLTPAFMTDKQGEAARWVKTGSRILWRLDGVPAAYTESYGFKAFQYTDLREYRALAFRLIWRTLRDRFYDAGMNNLDWPAMLRKYEPLAADAADRDTFERVVAMLQGELNASHTGFSDDDASRKEWGTEWKTRNWTVRTGHPGVRFDRAFAGPGLKIRDVIKGGPADTERSRLLPGEVVVRINGTEVDRKTNLAPLLTGIFPREDTFTVRDADGHERDVLLTTISYEEARDLLKEREIESRRKRVGAMSQGKLGYLHIERMRWPDLRQFEHEIFACGVGREGLVIDVRDNTGGFIADRLLAILCTPAHAITIPRDGQPSYPSDYLGKAMWDKPIVVLCNQRSVSNAEIFCHAIKTLKRGKLVGVTTEGAVIATPSQKILDMGTLRVPNRGWFVPDTGQDMELNGCVPDIEVRETPDDTVAGRDPQLDKAVEVLLQDVEMAAAVAPRPLVKASQRGK